MSILSNYVPNCIVRAEVSCPVNELTEGETMDANEFAEKFVRAIAIAKTEPYRAVTHNKGIMNGIDPIVVATGNDWRAIEAGAHAFAAQSGRYTSLTRWEKTDDGALRGEIHLPLALGPTLRIGSRQR